ncbi:hypothetical protein [Tardiphaga sp. 841_E9_N1_2]|uniref:hypothetical protein n=1 Tax=Tardiphaga sp. 841_E9_N1_2 TaxID=3240762 RepID=UPI003F20E945
MSVHTTTTDETLIGTGLLRVFVNIYPPLNGACGSAYKTRELAEQWAGRSRIACIEVFYEAGEGVDDVRD